MAELSPHPYIEWFSVRRNHYRIELPAGDAWILSESEAAELDPTSETIREALSARIRPTRDRVDPDWV